MANEHPQAPRAYEREPGTGTPVSEMVDLTFSAPSNMRDQIPKRIQATYVEGRRNNEGRVSARRRRAPWWKFWKRR